MSTVLKKICRDGVPSSYFQDITTRLTMHNIRGTMKYSSVKPSTETSVLCEHLTTRHIYCVCNGLIEKLSVVPQGEITQTTVETLTLLQSLLESC